MEDLPIYVYSDAALLKQMGALIKRRRIAAQMTQDEVAQAARLSRSTVSLLERGEAVTTSTLLQVLRTIQALDLLGDLLAKPVPSPMTMLREAKAEAKAGSARVRKTPNDELLKLEW